MLSVEILKRIQKIENKLGKKVKISLCHWPDPRLLGRIKERKKDIIVEFNDHTPGFFWHLDGINYLLGILETGKTNYLWRES